MGALLIGLALLASPYSSAHAGDLEDGQELLENGRIEQAIAAFRRAVKAAPDNLDAVRALWRSLLTKRDFEAADAEIVKALEHKPDDAELMLDRGRLWVVVAEAYYNGGAPADQVEAFAMKAETAIDAVLSKDEKSVAGRLLKARTMEFSLGQGAPQSKKLFEEVIAEAPESAEARREFGLFWFRLAAQDSEVKKLWARAEEHLTAAYDLDTSDGETLLQATYAKAWQGRDRDELARDFEEAALLLLGNPAPLTQIQRYSADPPEAFKRLLEQRPGHRQLELFRALALLRADRMGEAISLVDEAAKEAPEDAVAAANLFRVLSAAEIGDAAVDVAEKAITLTKGELDREVYDEVDAFAVHGKDLTVDQRERLWTALWKTFPGEINALNNAAVWYRDKAKDYERSRDWYIRAVAVAPDDVMLLNDTGLIIADKSYLNDPKAGEPYYRKAIDAAMRLGKTNHVTDIGYKDAVDNLVKLLLDQKRADDLLELTETVLKDDPRCDSIRLLAEGAK